MSLIDKLRGKKAERAATDYDAYRALVKADAEARAAGKELPDAKVVELDRLATSLGKSLEEVEADGQVFTDLAAADALYAERNAREKARRELSDKIHAHAAETTRLQAEHEKQVKAREQEAAGLRSQTYDVEQAHEATVEAGNAARQLRRQHAKLLGIAPEQVPGPVRERYLSYSGEYSQDFDRKAATDDEIREHEEAGAEEIRRLREAHPWTPPVVGVHMTPVREPRGDHIVG